MECFKARVAVASAVAVKWTAYADTLMLIADAALNGPPSDPEEIRWRTSHLALDSSFYDRTLAQVLLRDIFGNPFRQTTFPSCLRTPTALSLALAAYEGRELPSGQIEAARLAVLSDALEEAGCADADILDHLRSPGPHVRGCWALDLVLGRG